MDEEHPSPGARRRRPGGDPRQAAEDWLLGAVTQWLRREDNWRDVRELLLDRACLERGVFDRRRLERALSAFAAGSQLSAFHRTGRLWRWITLELWFQEFIDRAPSASLP